MQDANNVNSWANWVEEAISKNRIKYYEYNHFCNIKEIGTGSFGRVLQANWKNTQKHLALKSLANVNQTIIKEIVDEVININLYYI